MTTANCWRLPLATLNLPPGNPKTGLKQSLGIRFRGIRQSAFRVLKNIDIARKAWPFPVDGDAARDIAIGAATRKHAQHMGLQFSERRRSVFRSVPPVAARPCRPAFATHS